MSNQYVFNDRLPLAPLKIAALESCRDLAQKVNDHIVNFRRNDAEELLRRQGNLQYRGYDVDSYLLDCGCLNSLSETAQTTLANLITLVLGITISFSMKADQFVSLQTLMIMGLGLFAFIFDSIGGVVFAKFLNLFSKNKVNPMVGAAGISAFPMSARVIEKMGIAEDRTNHLLMHAIGANVSGQVASAVAGGIILGFFM